MILLKRFLKRIIIHCHELVFMSLVMCTIAASPATGFTTEKPGFSVRFKDEVSPYRVIGVFVLPEEVLKLEIVDVTKKGRFVLLTSGGSIIKRDTMKWQWRAPREKGLYHLRIYHTISLDTMTLNVFVMVPYAEMKGEYLNGYRIGKYPKIALKNLAIYKPPKGFIEVTEQNEETFIAPHFKLKQFLCKQTSGYPKYLVLRERLLLKLELILERVNEIGYKAETFNILSGYRTPYYNTVIGNVKYSRHNWGGAADIFIDEEPRDNMMDDLNNDGKVNYKDAAVLYDIIDDMYGKPWYERFVGGLGRYKKTPSHGPFVHVDVRGFHARWGD